MPFLVDSVSMAINQAGLATHAVIHPIFCVERDPGGHILAFGDEQSGRGAAESIMLFEIERVSDANEIETLRKNIVAAVEDVRAAVTDWPRMKAKMLEIAEQLPTLNLPFDQSSLDEAQEFLKWIADDHFTFVGYREYRVVEEDGEEVLKPVDDTGLGIMRGSEKGFPARSLKTAGGQRSGKVRFGRRPDPDQDQLALARASPRAHGLHRRCSASTPAASRSSNSASSGC